MKAVQITTNIRYVPLEDEEGRIGLFIVHEGDSIKYTIEVENMEQLLSTLVSFRDDPDGEDL